MYKLIRRYFGQLCDKETTDEEVYDEEVCFENRSLAVAENEYKKCVDRDIENGYVIDEQTEKNLTFGNLVRLFFSRQENWNDYIEMFIIKTDDEKDELEKELDNLAKQFYSLTVKEIKDVLLELEDKYTTHYQTLKNKLEERVIRDKLINFNGIRTINNNTFINFVKSLEIQFKCEIDLIDLSVRFYDEIRG